MAKNVCPYCGQKIPTGSAEQMWAHIHKKEEKEAKKLEKEQDKQIAKKIKEQEQELKVKYKEEYEEKLGEIEQKSFERARSTLTKEFEKKIKDESLEYQKLQKEYEKAYAQIEKMEQEKEKMYEKGQVEAKLEMQKEQVMLQSKVIELQRRLEHMTAEERGSKSEAEIFGELKREFPEDDIERVGKGKSGGDIIHIVNARGKACDTIVYEIKNVQKWSIEFLKRAKEYRQMYNTKHILIVTTAFPGTKKDFCVIDDICIVSPVNVLFVARLVRDSILEIEKLKLTGEEKEDKMHLLYSYLNSDEFKQKVVTITEQINQLEDILRKEEEDHRRKWERERDAQQKVKDSVIKVETKIESLLMSTPTAAMATISKKKKKLPPAEDI